MTRISFIYTCVQSVIAFTYEIFKTIDEIYHFFFSVTGGQPNIHPGSISSTGRGRVGGTATSTQAAQLIGGGITPNMFTSPATVSI